LQAPNQDSTSLSSPAFVDPPVLGSPILLPSIADILKSSPTVDLQLRPLLPPYGPPLQPPKDGSESYSVCLLAEILTIISFQVQNWVEKFGATEVLVLFWKCQEEANKN
jgi:hypothetical protein